MQRNALRRENAVLHVDEKARFECVAKDRITIFLQSPLSSRVDCIINRQISERNKSTLSVCLRGTHATHKVLLVAKRSS